MSKQDLKNHRKLVPVWHFVIPVLLLSFITGGIINLVKATTENKYPASMTIVAGVALVLIWWYERRFALIAQDRAIRAEENFRHFTLTGKPLDSNLRLRQIIALRFASDAEMPALAKKAVEQNLQPRQIKEAIQQWRPDYYRV